MWAFMEHNDEVFVRHNDEGIERVKKQKYGKIKFKMEIIRL